MPQHVYLPTRQPTRWFDRVLVHPNDHAVAVIALLFGVLMAIAFPLTGVVPSPALALLGAGLIVTSGAALLSGGLMVLAGHHWVGQEIATGIGLELAGWSLISGGLIAVALAFALGSSPAAWVIPAILAIGALLRGTSVLLIRRDIRKRSVAAFKATRSREDA